jgi:hypothetical protein
MLRRKKTSGTYLTVHGGWGAEMQKGKKPKGLDLDPTLPFGHPANCRYQEYENGVMTSVPNNPEPYEERMQKLRALDAERKSEEVEEAEEAAEARKRPEEEEGTPLADDWPTDVTCFIAACTLIVELGGELRIRGIIG